MLIEHLAGQIESIEKEIEASRYNKVNIDNKKKLENMVNGTKGQFMAMSNKIMKMVGK